MNHERERLIRCLTRAVNKYKTFTYVILYKSTVHDIIKELTR